MCEVDIDTHEAMKLLLAASLELFLRKDEFLNSFSGTLGTACFSSSLTLASMYFHVPGMHWQHCSHCEENLHIYTPLCPFYSVPGCLVKGCQNLCYFIPDKIFKYGI